MEIVTINSSFLQKTFRWLKFKKASNTSEAVQIAPFGDDSNPPNDYKGLHSYTSNPSYPVILGYFNRNSSVSQGEKKIFSVKNDGTISTYVYCKADGILELGGNTNFAVKYIEAKAELDKLKTTVNNLITAYNTHVHSGVTTGGGVSGVTASTATSNASDFSQLKNEKIKTI